jgi:hypothetical protein
MRRSLLRCVQRQLASRPAASRCTFSVFSSSSAAVSSPAEDSQTAVRSGSGTQAPSFVAKSSPTPALGNFRACPTEKKKKKKWTLQFKSRPVALGCAICAPRSTPDLSASDICVSTSTFPKIANAQRSAVFRAQYM